MGPPGFRGILFEFSFVAGTVRAVALARSRQGSGGVRGLSQSPVGGSPTCRCARTASTRRWFSGAGSSCNL